MHIPYTSIYCLLLYAKNPRICTCYTPYTVSEWVAVCRWLAADRTPPAFLNVFAFQLMLRWGWGWGGVGHVNVRWHLRHEYV